MRFSICILIFLIFLSGCFRTNNSDEENNQSGQAQNDIDSSDVSEDVTGNDFFEISKLREEGKYNEAINRLQTLELDTQDKVGLYKEFGLVYHEKEEYQTAINYFNRSMEEEKKILEDRASLNPYTYFNLANSYSKLGNSVESERYLKLAQEMLPNNSDFTQAAIEYNPVANAPDPNADIEFRLIPIRRLIDANNYNEALDELEKFPDTITSRGEVQKLIADTYSGLERYQDALNIYLALYEGGETDNFDVVLGIAFTNYNLENIEEFEEYYEIASNIASKDQQKALSYLRQALNFDDEIVFPRFNPDYAEGGDLYSDIQPSLNRIQNLYDVENNPDSAFNLATELNSQYPNHPEILYWLGRINLVDRQNFNDSYSFYKRSFEADSSDIYTLEGLFWSSIRLGKIEEAEAYYSLSQNYSQRFESDNAARAEISR